MKVSARSQLESSRKVVIDEITLHDKQVFIKHFNYLNGCLNGSDMVDSSINCDNVKSSFGSKSNCDSVDGIYDKIMEDIVLLEVFMLSLVHFGHFRAFLLLQYTVDIQK